MKKILLVSLMSIALQSWTKATCTDPQATMINIIQFSNIFWPKEIATWTAAPRTFEEKNPVFESQKAMQTVLTCSLGADLSKCQSEYVTTLQNYIRTFLINENGRITQKMNKPNLSIHAKAYYKDAEVEFQKIVQKVKPDFADTEITTIIQSALSGLNLEESGDLNQPHPIEADREAKKADEAAKKKAADDAKAKKDAEDAKKADEAAKKKAADEAKKKADDDAKKAEEAAKKKAADDAKAKKDAEDAKKADEAAKKKAADEAKKKADDDAKKAEEAAKKKAADDAKAKKDADDAKRKAAEDAKKADEAAKKKAADAAKKKADDDAKKAEEAAKKKAADDAKAKKDADDAKRKAAEDAKKADEAAKKKAANHDKSYWIVYDDSEEKMMLNLELENNKFEDREIVPYIADSESMHPAIMPQGVCIGKIGEKKKSFSIGFNEVPSISAKSFFNDMQLLPISTNDFTYKNKAIKKSITIPVTKKFVKGKLKAEEITVTITKDDREKLFIISLSKNTKNKKYENK